VTGWHIRFCTYCVAFDHFAAHVEVLEVCPEMGGRGSISDVAVAGGNFSVEPTSLAETLSVSISRWIRLLGYPS
tara:strand:+ start:735 stop:956 length:222 start_codon:yes stop_codon:yes gene_type:complete